MFNFLEHIDHQLFIFINGLNNSSFDLVMYYASEKWFWIPLYLFLIVLLFKKFGIKAAYIILPIVLLVLGTDQISVLIKNEVARYRPCHNLELIKIVHNVNGICGGKFGFVSSHSANAFGLFAYLSFILPASFKSLKWIMFFWALILAYSRIYLGVHYPFDVIGGALLGILIAFVVVRITQLIYKKYDIRYD